MSGICGIGQRDASATELRGSLDLLLGDLADFGTVIHRQQEVPQVAFGQRQSLIYRRDSLEHQPATLGDVSLMADSRLMEPERLAMALGIGPSARHGMADSELLVAAWQQWGESALDHIDGEFCLCVWDAAAQRMTLARDALGLRPLYYAEWTGGIAFSSSLTGLLCLPQVDLSLDDQAIADYLATVALDDGSTPYRGIRRLPPGSALTWSPQRAARWRRYWSISTAPLVHLPSADDYVDAVKARVQTVIANCCDTDHEVGLILSGGLDSSTLAGLAAPHLAAQGRRLISASSVLPLGHQGAARDERVFMEAVCAAHPNIVPLWVTAPDDRLLDGADDDLRRRGQPPWNPFAVMDKALHSALDDAGVRVMIDGLHGDSVWSFESPLFVLDFALRGRPWHAWREWRAFGRRHGIGRRGLAKMTAAELAPWLPRFGGDPRTRLAADVAPTAATLELIERAHLAQRGRRLRRGSRPAFTLRAAQHADLSNAIWPQLREEIARTAAWRGFSHRSPLWDRQVILLCLSAPPQALYRGGFGRALARQIGVGIVPDSVRTRTDKGAFLPDFHARVLRERDDILARLCSAKRGQLAGRYIDFSLLEAALAKLTGEVDVRRWSLEAQSVIVRGQAMARFLHYYERMWGERVSGKAPTCLLPPPKSA